MYKLYCRQKTGDKKERVYLTKEDVLSDLRNYHRPDIQAVDAMSLEDLLEAGDWELVDVLGLIREKINQEKFFASESITGAKRAEILLHVGGMEHALDIINNTFNYLD